MKTLSLLTLFGLGAVVVAENAYDTVNFYYDENCQNYAGAVNVQAGAGNTGGPPGARSGMFVNEGGDCNIRLRGFESGDGFLGTTKIPNAWSSGQQGTCVSIPSNGGIYATLYCQG